MLVWSLTTWTLRRQVFPGRNRHLFERKRMTTKLIAHGGETELIDLDTLLHGEPTWASVLAFWKDGECHEEQYKAAAIKKYLRTEEDRKLLYERDLSIEDCLNGRYPITQERKIRKMKKAWNKKLGLKGFIQS